MASPERRRRHAFLSRARHLATLGCALVAALASGCATYQVASYDDSPAGVARSTTTHAFFWGAVPGQIPYDACGVPGHPHGNGLWQVSVDMNAADLLASFATLGIWTPAVVSYQCAVPRPGHLGIGGPTCDDASARPVGLPACAEATAGTAAAETMTPIRDSAYDLDCVTGVTWSNISQQVQAKPKRFCTPKPGRGLTLDQRVAPIAALVQQAAKDNARIRAVGASWSFSRAAASDGTMVDMRWFGASLPLPEAGDWAPGTAGRFFAHFEAGTSVDAVNLALQNKGYALLTMGGSAGQTFVGAVSTGTHGGDTAYRAIADYLQAVAVVTEGGKLVWIERKSAPLTRGGYAAKIGARLVQDDETFNAAITSVGSLGIVVSAVIEVQQLESYMLWRQAFDYDDKLRKVMQTFDFTEWKWPDPRQTAFAGKRVRQHGSLSDSTLRHFEVVVNPYAVGAGKQGAYVTSVWGDNNLIVPAVASGGAINVESAVGTAIVRFLREKEGPDVPAAVTALLPTQYGVTVDPIEGPLRALFPKGIPTGGLPLSMELGVARDDVNRAMDIVLAQINDHPNGYYYPGVVAFRFSEGTEALLGFSSFPDTVTIEFPTVAGVSGTPAFFTRVHRALDAAKIAHTQHLGQWNTYWDDPSGMSAFGDRVARFRRVREALLATPQARCSFGNDYTDRLGITDVCSP